MNIYKAYTYLIGWSHQDKYYYGVRYANQTNPQDDFWNKYFTSSNYVSECREEHGEPDIIQIRKTFETSEAAIKWEFDVLRRMKVLDRDDFLNKSIGGAIVYDDEVRAKISAAAKAQIKRDGHPMQDKKHTDESRAKMSASQIEYFKTNPSPRKGVKVTDECRAKMSESRKEWFKHNTHPNKGKTFGDEVRKNMSESHKEWFKHNTHPNKGKKFGSPKKTACVNCGLEVSPGPMARYHGKNCKSLLDT